MLLAFLGDAEGVVAGEVDEPLAGDDLGTVLYVCVEVFSQDSDNVGAFAEEVLRLFYLSSVVIM